MKKTLILIAIMLAVTAGVYFGIGHFRTEGPEGLTVAQAYHIWASKQVAAGNLGGFGILESEQDLIANPGGAKIGTITIFNTRDKDRTFWISIEQANPDKLPTGYECLPTKYFNWFTPSGWDGSRVTAEPKVVVKAGEYRHVSILVAIPTNTDYLNQPAELRVRVTELSGGFQITALESRWYIVVVETPV